MLRRKRITARGGWRRKISRSSGRNSGPLIPTPKSRELNRASRRVLEPALERGEERKRRDRSQIVHVDLAELVEHELLRRRKEEELTLPRALSLMPRENRGAAHVELLLLEVVENLPGAVGSPPREPRQPGDVDPVAAVGRPRHDLSQKDHTPVELANRHRRIGDRRPNERDLGQLVVMRGEEDERLLAGAVVE